LIAGPGVCVCDRCVAQAVGLSVEAPVTGWAEGSMRLEASESAARCSFCGKDGRHGVLLVASGLAGVPGGRFGLDGARICDECLDLCLEILAETAGIASEARRWSVTLPRRRAVILVAILGWGTEHGMSRT
jgi:hypothetical protein